MNVLKAMTFQFQLNIHLKKTKKKQPLLTIITPGSTAAYRRGREKKKKAQRAKKVKGCRVALCGVHLRVFTESRVSTLESVWVANGFRFPIQGGWGRGWGAGGRSVH